MPTVYPLNHQVLMVQLDRDLYSPVRILECSEQCLKQTVKALCRFWRKLGEPYRRELEANAGLAVGFQRLASWDYPAEAVEQLRRTCAQVVHTWCEMQLCKQVLAPDGTMEPFRARPAQPPRSKRSSEKTLLHRDYGFAQFTQELQSPSPQRVTTYVVHTVSPVEVHVECGTQWAVTKRLTVDPVAAGTLQAVQFWDTQSTLHLIELFVRDYEDQPEFLRADILLALEPLRHMFYNTGDVRLTYASIVAEPQHRFYYACCVVLFCRFLQVWQNPCLNNPECQLRPSAVDYSNTRRTARKETAPLS